MKIFDTTLRDGEQSPGFSMTVAEKIRMAHRQLECHWAWISSRAGSRFPLAAIWRACARLSREIRGCTVAALARARRDDIDAALERTCRCRPSQAAYVSRDFGFTSPSAKLRLTFREEALEAISNNVRYAREHCAEVEFSAEDASRTDSDFLCRAVGRAVHAGATTINLPDTTGYAVPDE